MAENPDWRNGVGLAAMALMSGLLDKLAKRGILEDSEILDVIRAAGRYLEEIDAEGFAPEVVITARAALEDMGASYDPDQTKE